MNDRFKPLNFEDEVLSVEAYEKIFSDYPMFKIGQFISKAKYILQRFGNYNAQQMEKWFSKGIDCEILKLGAKGWQKGKVRIRVSLEFCPDEPETSQPESPLNDIRQMIKENSQQDNL